MFLNYFNILNNVHLIKKCSEAKNFHPPSENGIGPEISLMFSCLKTYFKTLAVLGFFSSASSKNNSVLI